LVTNQSVKFITRNVRKTLRHGDRSFPVAATRARNALPDFVTIAPNISSFSATHLFSCSFWQWQHTSHWLCNVVLKRCALAWR